jgi:hypothetical protein
MKSAIWICYDLGVRGNYSGLYAWLDEHSAQECAASVAFLVYEHSEDSPLQPIRQEMNKLFSDTNRVRIYLIYRESKTKKMKGVFVLGSRQAPPWTGYAARPSPADEEFTEEEDES